jgi:hypothetical protein
MPTETKKPINRLTNYMEELTGSILEDLLDEYRPARFSDTAIRDIKALALNRLWPMYTTSDSGKDFIKKVVVEDQVEKDVIRELRAAIDIVKTHPRR